MVFLGSQSTSYLSNLKDFLASFGIIISGNDHFMNKCPTATALENAFYMGNEEQEQYLISCKILLGEKGGVIRIRDSGNGFDYERVQSMFEKSERYYLGRIRIIIK